MITEETVIATVHAPLDVQLFADLLLAADRVLTDHGLRGVLRATDDATRPQLVAVPIPAEPTS